MSDLGTGLRTWALTKPAITDLIVARWYPDELPQGATVPAVVYELISGDEEGHLGGRVEVSHVRMQLDAIALTRTAAVALADAIRGNDTTPGLSGFRGNMGSVFIEGVSVASGLRCSTEELESGSDRRYRIASRDYLISFQDA